MYLCLFSTMYKNIQNCLFVFQWFSSVGPIVAAFFPQVRREREREREVGWLHFSLGREREKRRNRVKRREGDGGWGGGWTSVSSGGALAAEGQGQAAPCGPHPGSLQLHHLLHEWCLHGLRPGLGATNDVKSQLKTHPQILLFQLWWNFAKMVCHQHFWD